MKRPLRPLGRLAFASLLTSLAHAQESPQILSLSPANLATELDPGATKTLAVVFDRDMETTGHGVGGDASQLPIVSSTQWRDRRTFCMQVDLEADHVYTLDLSRGPHRFRSADGIALAATTWRFATRGEPLPAEAVDHALIRLQLALQERYARRDSRGVDWNRVERDHREQLDACRSGAGLALVLADMLGNGQDVDVEVGWGKTRLRTFVPIDPGNYASPGLQKRLPDIERIGRIGAMVRTADGIAYLQIASFAAPRRELDQLMQALRSLRDCKAMVIDVRMSSGGDEAMALRIASFFVEGEQVYAQHRQRDAAQSGGFSAPQPHVLRGNDSTDVYTGPVAVLMGPQVRDTAELFLLMMQRARSVVLVGARSYGSVGNPEAHALLPGVTAYLPSWILLRANASTFEGEGVTPGLLVDSTFEDHLSGDPVLDAALARLRGQR